MDNNANIVLHGTVVVNGRGKSRGNDGLTWLAEYYAAVWDRQVERDLDAGRVDALLAELDEEYDAELAQPLSLIG